jgi:hypothetical protein
LAEWVESHDEDYAEVARDVGLVLPALAEAEAERDGFRDALEETAIALDRIAAALDGFGERQWREDFEQACLQLDWLIAHVGVALSGSAQEKDAG